MAQAKIGTRGNCRHCGRSLVFQKRKDDGESYRYRAQKGSWWHVEKDIPKGADEELLDIRFYKLEDGMFGTHRCESSDVDSWKRFNDAAPREYCVSPVRDYNTVCNREVTYQEGAHFLCGIHAKPYVERAEQDRKRKIRDAKKQANIEEAGAIIDMFKERWGIVVAYESDYTMGATGKIIVDPKDLFKIMDGET